MNVELSDRALREMQRIDVYWRAGFYDAKAKRQVHRLLLETSEYHVYLARKSEELIVVVSIWGARRKRGPKL